MPERADAPQEHAGHALPEPTIWPAAMAAGITLAAAGLVTNWLVLLGGALLLALSVWGWVRDLLGDDGADHGQAGACDEAGAHDG